MCVCMCRFPLYLARDSASLQDSLSAAGLYTQTKSQTVSHITVLHTAHSTVQPTAMHTVQQTDNCTAHRAPHITQCSPQITVQNTVQRTTMHAVQRTAQPTAMHVRRSQSLLLGRLPIHGFASRVDVHVHVCVCVCVCLPVQCHRIPQQSSS